MIILKKSAIPSIILVNTLLLVFINLSHAQDDARLEVNLESNAKQQGQVVIQSKLDELKISINEQQDKLSSVIQKKQALEKELSKLSVQAESLEKEAQRLIAKLNQLGENQKSAQIELTKAEDGQRKVQRAALERLRSIYIHSELRTPAMIILNSSKGEEDYIGVYLERIGKFDQKMLMELRVSADIAKEKTESLKKILTEQEEVKLAHQGKQNIINQEITKRNQMKEDIAKQQKEVERSIGNLRKEANRLDGIIRLITQTGSLNLEVPKATPTIAVTQSTLEVRKTIEPIIKPSPTQEEADIELSGLFTRKERFPRPVVGVALQGSNSAKAENLEDMIFTKGIAFSTTPGIDVTAIANAKVMYVGTLPGYGRTVILDHGERSYSLYGRLSSIIVNVGQLVRLGEKIAKSADPAEKAGRTLYFEVRKNGVPVNPQEVLGG